MAINETEIANLALNRLGEEPVSDLADTNNPDAVIMSDLFPGTRKEVLSVFPWNCAVKRVRLAVHSLDNLTDYNFAYVLPDDVVRVLDIDGQKNVTYRIEGNVIYTDAGVGDPATCVLRYIYNLTDVSLWDEILEEAVINKLAEKACLRIAQNMNLMAFLQQEYINTLTIAQQGANSEDREDIATLLAQLNNAKLMDMLTKKNNFAMG